MILATLSLAGVNAGAEAPDVARRVLELAPEIHPEQFLERHGIVAEGIFRLAGESSVVHFWMDDAQWQERSARLCEQEGVRSCQTDGCIEQFPGPAKSVQLLAVAPPIPMLGEESVGSLPDQPSRVGRRDCDAPGDSVAQRWESRPETLESPGLDLGCWQLESVRGCATSAQPASERGTELEPDRILVQLQQPPDAEPLSFDALAAAIATRLGVELIETEELPESGVWLARLAAEPSALMLLDLAAQPEVASAQPEYRYRTRVFDDPYAWMNPAFAELGVDRLQSRALGVGVQIAVVDTGVDADHPELTGVIAAQSDVSGFGLAPERHGTAVAGLLAAKPDNGIGAFGVAPGAILRVIKACVPDATGTARCWSSTLARALDLLLADEETRIVNLSLAGPARDPLVESLLEQLAQKNKLIVAAALQGPARLPASHPQVLGVGSDGSAPAASLVARADGAAVPLPGETLPGKERGSSLAAALTSGTAALLLELDPGLTADELRRTLVDSATPGPAGTGNLNACAAASAVVGSDACPD